MSIHDNKKDKQIRLGSPLLYPTKKVCHRVILVLFQENKPVNTQVAVSNSQNTRHVHKSRRLHAHIVTRYRHGYSHIELSPGSKQLCTIALPWGDYEYQNFPMGVCNTSDILKRKYMNCLKRLIWFNHIKMMYF